MVIKCIYRIYMYKPLLINVSVSLIVNGVQPHMTQLLQQKVQTLQQSNLNTPHMSDTINP